MGLHRAGTPEPLGTARRRLVRLKSDQWEKTMASTWEKTKVYTKLFFICVVILAAVIFICSNTQPVAVGFGWWTFAEIGTWLLIVLAGLAGVLVFFVVSRTSSLLRDFRRLRSESRAHNKNSRNADSPS